jgi:hypothetical protein
MKITFSKDLIDTMSNNDPKQREAIVAKLKQFRPLEALALAETAHKNDPENWSIIATLAECLKILGHYQEASNILTQACKTFPTKVAARSLLSKIKLFQGKFDDAEDLIENAYMHGMPLEAYYSHHATISRQRNNIFQELKYLKAASDLAPLAKTRIHTKYADRCLRLGDIDTATLVANDLASDFSQNSDVKALQTLILGVTGEYDALQSYMDEWVNSKHFKPASAGIVYALLLQTNLASLKELLTKVILTWPNHPATRTLGLRLGVIPPKQTLQSLINKAPEALPPALVATEALFMAANGNLNQAQDVVRHYAQHWPTGYDVTFDEEASLIMSLPQDSALQRPVLANGPELDWQISPKGSAARLVIIMTGFSGTPFMPRCLCDRFFAALNCQVLYLHDANLEYFFNGVPSCGTSVEDMYDALRKEISVYGTENVTIIGTSAGGFAAVRTAAKLGINHAIQMAPVAQVSNNQGRMMTDERDTVILARVDKLVKKDGPTLHQDFLGAGEDFKADVFFSPHVNFEIEHVAALRAFESVTLWKLNRAKRHNVFTPVLVDGLLGDLIDQEYDRIRECYPPE